MTTRKYSSRSQQTTLSAALTASATTATVLSGSNLRGGIDEGSITGGTTFTVVIDPDTALEEIVDITAINANTLTIVRGVENNGTGQAHSAGAVVRHMVTGRDLREANEHIENTTTAHGLTLANVVKTTDTGTVSSGMIAAGAVGTAKIDDTAVTAAKLAPNAVTTAKIADLNVTTAKIADDAITSAKIAAGTIVDSDINSAAAIAKTKISGTAITAADTGTVTSTMIADGTIVNSDINSSAQIAYGKLTLTNSIVNADINASAAIDKTKISGTAITAADSGTVTSTMIADGTIVNADINASAAIDWTKIAPSSTVSATELGYLDGVTSAVQTQLDSKLATSTAASTYAPLASPALTGVPTAPTATAGTNTTQVATTAFVKTAVDNVVAAAPGALDTLNELAASLGNDANFATTVTNNLATKLPLAGGTMTGAIAMGSNKITGLGTPTATGDAATKDYADTKLALAGGTMTGAIAMGTNKITGLGNPTTNQDAATKYYVDNVTVAPSNLTGPITSVGNVTSVASQTGTGSTFVMNTSPTLVTPVLGVATATSINGTTIPTSKTLVATDSTAYVVPSQTGNAGKFLITDGTTSSWSTTVLGTFVSNSASTDGDSARNISLQIDGATYGRIVVPTGSGGAMAFWTGANPAQRMIISNTGNVFISNRLGIGASISSGMMAGIINTTAADVGLVVRGAASQTGDLLQIQNSAATALVKVDSSGNTGIGTTTTLTSRLTLIGNTNNSASTLGTQDVNTINLTSSNGAALGIKTKLLFGFTDNTVVGYSAVAGYYASYNGANDIGTGLIFGTQTNAAGGTVERMRIDASGFVGIGGTPTYLLDVQQSGGNTYQLRLLNTNNAATTTKYAQMIFGGTDTIGTAKPAVILRAYPDDANFVSSGFSIFTRSSDANIERMRIDSSGNVGIGTSTMTGKLNVTGAASGISAYFTDATNSSLAIANLAGGVTLGTDAGGAIHLASNGSGVGNRRLSIDSSGNTTINSIAAGTTSTAAVGGGYMGLPQNSTTTGAYTVVAADAGKHIYSTATRTVTIDSNANLALPVGTTLTFISGVGATTTIAITTDTMYLAGTGTTGSRTLAAYGMATAVKIASTTWIISGNGLT